MKTTTQELCRHIRRNGLWAHWDGAPNLGAITIGGPDSQAFLQSQLTSDVNNLEPGTGQMSARVDRKGLLLAWFSLHRLADRGQPYPVFMLLMQRDLIASVVADLERSIISESVFLEDASDMFQGIILTGEKARQAEFPHLIDISFQLTGDFGKLFLWHKDTSATVNQENLEGWATDNGLVPLDDSPEAASAWAGLLLEAGWPVMGKDMKTGSMVLPQTGLERHVVSNTKGCYLGQEVLARIRSYGSVKWALRGLVFEDAPAAMELPASGEKLVDEQGNTIGQWATHTYSTVWDAPVALVFLDREHRTPGATLVLKTPGGMPSAKVTMLPFHSADKPAEQARNLHQRAVHLFSQGHDLQAANLLEEAIGLDPTHRDSYEALGVILGRGERYHQAIDIFHRLEEVAPDEPMVHTNLSLYYMKIGNRPEAERQRALSTMKKFGVTDPEALRQQEEAENKARVEDAQRKRSMFAEVLTVDPDDSLALMGLGDALCTLGEYQEAEDCLGRAVAGQKDNSTLYLSHSQVLEKLGRHDEARQVLRRGVAVASRRGDLMPLREMEHRLMVLG